MKNIILIITVAITLLFIILIIVFTFSSKTPNNIVKIVEVHKDSCYYKVNIYWARDNTLCCSSYILDTCGKYKDGEEIRRPNNLFIVGSPMVMHVDDSLYLISQHSYTVRVIHLQERKDSIWRKLKIDSIP